MTRPRLHSNYDVRLEPRQGNAEDALVFTSGSRMVRLAGRNFADFVDRVIPLLDGRHTIPEIQTTVASVFPAAQVERAILLLERERLVEDATLDVIDEAARTRHAPLLHWLREMGADAQPALRQLNDSTIAVLGSGVAAAHACWGLQAAGVGQIRTVEPSLTDFRESLHDVRFAIVAVDAGLSSVLYRVNRLCLELGIPWTSALVAGPEGHLGPTVIPGRGACYLCYKMRTVACATDPAAAFAHERFLDQRKQDDSARRENLPFLEGLLGNLLGLEAMKVLTGLEPAAAGRLVVFDTLTLQTTHHVVLQKPGCPDCGR